jgi:tetratricopeptide (TPR) repeat protein
MGKEMKFLLDNDLFFTASTYLKSNLSRRDTYSKRVSAQFDRIVRNTNIFVFLDLDHSILKRLKHSKDVSFLIGKKYFLKRDYSKAIKYFGRVKKNSPFYLQSLYHLAGLYKIKGDKKGARKFARRCVRVAKTSPDILPNESGIQFKKIDFIKENCELILPRNEYKNGSRKRSISLYDKIPSNAYTFPQMLFENSWNFYIRKKYNLAIGRNLTFQAPIMDQYFIPETELVKTLSYIDLCQYEEATKVIKNFEKHITKNARNFIKELKSKEKQKYPFMRLMFSKKLKKKLKDNFVLRLVDVIMLNPNFQTIDYYLESIIREKKKLKQFGRFKGRMRTAYLMSYRNYVDFFNDYVKKKFVDFTNDIIRLNNKFIELELDIYSNLKYKLYKNKKKKDDDEDAEREVFFVKEINRDTNQYYWNFMGEFWADELGHYIPVLENQCGLYGDDEKQARKIRKKKRKRKEKK